jgi:hypothetical protein
MLQTFDTIAEDNDLLWDENSSSYISFNDKDPNEDNQENFELWNKKNIEDNFFETSKGGEKSKVRQLGRKRRGDESVRKHTKNSKDNQMKKIRSYAINTALIQFLNNILKGTEFKSKKFQKVNYQHFIQNLTIGENLEFLEMRLYDLLTYTSKEKNQNNHGELTKNQILVNEIMKNTNANDDIRIVLNIELKKWFNIFTKKEELKDLKLAKTPEFLNKDDFLIQLEKKEKDLQDYHTSFEDLLDQLSSWFENKTQRPSKKKIK